MTNYLTRTGTLTLSENDYRTIENMQEEMENMTLLLITVLRKIWLCTF